MWGEHGKGYRSEYGPEFFGEELFTELRKIKTVFDPNNRLNPGKICTPIASKESLVSVDGVKRAHFDQQIPVMVKESFNNAMDCNGNGLCYNYAENSPMCPSYKVTKDRRFSPKGRASLMREWLRLQTNKGVDLLDIETDINNGNTIAWWKKSAFSKQKNQADYDFSHEVKESMDECLACKACTTACPINVDVPTFRARFLNLYHSRYKRPIKDYLVANIEKQAPLLSKLHAIVNPVLKLKVVEYFLKHVVGYVDSPLLSDNKILKSVTQSYPFDLNKLAKLSVTEKQKTVLLVQDPFTSFYEAELVRDFCELLTKLDINVVVLPYHPNGKPQHVKGFLRQFAQTAENSAEFLNQVAKLNIPMVGLDASLVMCYRDEYNQVLGDSRGDFHVQLAHEWFSTQSFVSEKVDTSKNKTFVLLSHCTETTAMPNASKVWQQLYKQFGLELKTPLTGCCGMAGTYGHEAQNVDKSKALYKMSWQDIVNDTPIDQLLATGFSCRSQVKRFNDGHKPQHPIQLLNQLL
jgi:Fe-S oxidoreductase